MTVKRVESQSEREFLRDQAKSRGSSFRIPLKSSERRVLLVILDLLAINTALFFALSLRPEYKMSLEIALKNPYWFILLSLLWLPVAHTFDAYDLRTSGRFSTAFLSILKAGLVTATIYLFIPFITPLLPSSRSKLFAYFIMILAFPLVFRGLYLLGFSQPLFNRRAFIIGNGPPARRMAKILSEEGHDTYEVVGFINPGSAGKESPSGGNILGDIYSLQELIREHRITTLILAKEGNTDGELLQILMDSLELGVEILPGPILYEKLTGRVPLECVGEDNWYMAMSILHSGAGAIFPAVKRFVDIVLSSFGFFCLAIATPFIALAIYVDSPGPIFYSQERVGKGGRRFKAIKFRSMVPDAEKGKAVWAQKNDKRVTRVGKILRKTHVDEFPQFVNILKGEMSVVGPRAERPEFVEELAQEIHFYRVRHAVKPGMAGWGLVRQGYGGTKEEAKVKLEYDLYYIKHQSPWLDTVIFLKTVVNTLTFRGRA